MKSIKITFLLLLVMLLGLSSATAQRVCSGIVVDAETGEGLPYASIYIAQAQSGSITSEAGSFRLTLPAGRYEAEVRSLGYETQRFALDLEHGDVEQLRLALRMQVRQLRTLEVSGQKGKEDPAYPIMRRVMYRVPLWRGMLQTYTMNTFTRGTIRIKSVSKFINMVSNGEDINLRDMVGKTFVSEIQTEVKYSALDSYHQRILAQRTSAPPGMDILGDADMSDLLTTSIYAPYISSTGSTAINSLNPITPEAYNVYRYELTDRIVEAGRTIYVIAFRSRSSSRGLTQGRIEVVGDEWAVRSLDITMKHLGMLTEHITIGSAEVRPGLYLPTTYQLGVDASALGIAGEGHFYSSCRYTAIDLSAEGERLAELRRQEDLAPRRLTSRDVKEHEREVTARLRPTKGSKAHDPYLVEENEGRQYEVEHDSLAGARSNEYWQSISPIPLDTVERLSFSVRDSLQRVGQRTLEIRIPLGEASSGVHVTPNYSLLNRISNVLMGSNALLYHTKHYRLATAHSALSTLLHGYNVADEFQLGASFALERHADKRRLWRATAGASYATGRQTWLWEAGLNLYLDPWHNTVLRLTAGRNTESITHEDRPIYMVNAISTALWGSGYMSLYDRQHATATLSTMPSPHLLLGATIGYERSAGLEPRELKSLFRHSTWGSWGHSIRPDLPHDGFLPVPSATTWVLDTRAQWTARPYHQRSSEGWLSYSSLEEHSPVLAGRLRVAYSPDEMGSRYALLELGVRQKIQLRRYVPHYLGYRVRAGVYLYDDGIAPNERIYIKGTNSLVGSSFPFAEVFTLPSFTAVTSRAYALAGVRYQRDRMLINYLPIGLLRHGDETLSLQCFVGNGGSPYLEAGYSWGFSKAFRLGFYWGRYVSGTPATDGFALRASIDL